MSTMKVLFLSRSNLTTVPAGDTFQILNTKKALEDQGVQVDLVLRSDPTKQGYTLVHLFNTIPIQEVLPAFQWAKKAGLPIVLSPIYWDAAGWVKEIEASQAEKLRLKWWQETQDLRKQIITGADLLLPNAHAEAEKIKADFCLSSLQYKVVPNAADRSFGMGNAHSFRKRYKIWGDYIFCSARVDARKNQLALIDALLDTDLQVVFAGAGSDITYFHRFQQKLGPKMTYLGPLQPRQLANAYAAAKVHALVSWYDTPGLSSLEAALAGCKIVTTDRGTAREYFGPEAYYCQPGNPSSIREAVLAAIRGPKSSLLRQMVAENYCWERVGQLTKQAYLTLNL